MWDFESSGLNTVEDLFNFCQSLKYGWVDRAGNRHLGVNDSDEYYLQSPAEVLENKIAICWDETELQRAWFIAHDFEVATYFLYYYVSDDNCPSHAILVFRDGNKYCWFEPMFQDTRFYASYSGIHKFDNLEDLLGRFYTRFMKHCKEMQWLPQPFDIERLALYEYERPPYGISGAEFYDHCRAGRKISLRS